MAPAMITTTGSDGRVFEGKTTFAVILCGIIAGTGGLMLAFQASPCGILLRVTGMDNFLEKFFPHVYLRKQHAFEDNYCKYNDQGLQLFTSSLYLAALLASFAASKVCSSSGRRLAMQGASLFFLLGVLLNTIPHDLGTLIAGRIVLGFGIGFANRAVPLFLSEIVPVHIRGALNILFQLNITIGIFIANMVFQQCTGINAIMFCAPVLFQTMGFKNDASLLSAVITGRLTCFARSSLSSWLIRRDGKCCFWKHAFRCLSHRLRSEAYTRRASESHRDLRFQSHVVGGGARLFVESFAWSWGPLGWLIPSQTFPIETRTAGFAFPVISNMLLTFVIAQAFLTMMCMMKAGIFFFFAAWIVIMCLFTIFLLPETKNIPMDEMNQKVWKQHGFRKKFMDDENDKKACSNEKGVKAT